MSQFFERVAELLKTLSTADHGSVFFIQKRLSHPDPAPTEATASSKPFTDLVSQRPYPVLIRATNSKSKKDKVKLATVVQSDELVNFYARYADVCRVCMTALKKRDRSKGKKKKKDKKDASKS